MSKRTKFEDVIPQKFIKLLRGAEKKAKELSDIWNEIANYDFRAQSESHFEKKLKDAGINGTEAGNKLKSEFIKKNCKHY